MPLVLSFFPRPQAWRLNFSSCLLTPFVTNPRFFHSYFVILSLSFGHSHHYQLVIKFLGFIFSEIGKQDLTIEGFYHDWANPSFKMARFMVIAFSAVVAFPYLPGSDSPAFKGVSVFLGVLFSLGSSSAIANVVAGVILTYMRAFKLGDRVKIADTVGDVVEKNSPGNTNQNHQEC